MASVYALVHNIPSGYHSKELRHFFSNFIENSRFECFHFRHRPEIKVSSQKDEEGNSPSTSSTNTPLKTCCCLVRLSIENRPKFIKEFHLRKWDSCNSDLRCYISRVKISDSGQSSSDDGKNLTSSDLSKMLELRPPALMPRGNVGTESRHFQDLIRDCKLPPSVIKKLGLDFSSSRARRYGNVHFEYEGKKRKGDDIEEQILEQMNPGDPDSEPDDDKDNCEEWERHEALNDDVTQHERTKQKLFEEEMEVVWEKGGPGLVFYTDSFYWDQQEPDTDEKWADDWDVDMSVYYEKGAGDKDAKDFVQMRRERALEGSAESSRSVFSKPRKPGRKRHLSDSDTTASKEKFAHFETFSKGIGRKVLESQGWRMGDGLGSKQSGKALPVALDVELSAQSPHDRKGLGYKGEKMQRYGLKKQKERHMITTVYDHKQFTDPKPDFMRRTEGGWIKHR